MNSPAPRLYLLHILDCCKKILECNALRGRGGVPEHLLLDAVCRNLEILGEAARKVGPEFRAAHSSIPWREMSDLRNVLIHNYEGVDEVIVWAVVETEIPGLRNSIRQLLDESSMP